MFTKELVNQIMEYYATEHGQTISEETAEVYLNSLADLFDSFGRLLSEKKHLKNYNNSGTISE